MLGQFDYYNVQVNEGRDGFSNWVIVNVYDKNITQDGEEVSVESEKLGEEIDIIKPKFLERITVDIPSLKNE